MAFPRSRNPHLGYGRIVGGIERIRGTGVVVLRRPQGLLPRPDCAGQGGAQEARRRASSPPEPTLPRVPGCSASSTPTTRSCSVPSHGRISRFTTFGSENDIRCQVTRRKISGGTRSQGPPRLPRRLPRPDEDLRQARRLVLGHSRQPSRHPRRANHPPPAGPHPPARPTALTARPFAPVTWEVHNALISKGSFWVRHEGVDNLLKYFRYFDVLEQKLLRNQ